MSKLLNVDAVKKIKKAIKLRKKLTNKSLARQYNVAPGTIKNIVKGSRWGWVK